jgi:hypothetical protein
MNGNTTHDSAQELQRGGSEVSLLRRILRSIAPAAAFSAAPAIAQPSASSFEIRIANSAPPRSLREGVPARPERDAFWIKGYWQWEGSRWGWTGGRWERPEQRSHRWVAPRYARVGKVWSYEPPHWSHQRLAESNEYRRWKQENRRR